MRNPGNGYTHPRRDAPSRCPCCDSLEAELARSRHAEQRRQIDDLIRRVERLEKFQANGSRT